MTADHSVPAGGQCFAKALLAHRAGKGLQSRTYFNIPRAVDGAVPIGVQRLTHALLAPPTGKGIHGRTYFNLPLVANRAVTALGQFG